MFHLSKPRFDDAVTPELIGRIIDAVRESNNLSGVNCTIRHTGSGLSICVPPQVEPRRGRLLEDLYGCSSAKAVEIIVKQDGSEAESQQFTLFDRINKIVGEPLAIPDADGELYLPAGMCFDSHWKSDSQSWEFDEAGLCCQGSGSEGSESEGSEGSGPCRATLQDLLRLPDGKCPGWVEFLDCDGALHHYWGD